MNFFGDELQYANEVYSLQNYGSLFNDRFGWPGGQNLTYAFISGDLGPIIASAILGLPSKNPFLGLNLFFLLSFSLVATSMYISARILGSNRIFSAFAGLCTSVTLIHFLYNPMGISGSSYFLIPIFIAIITMKLIRSQSRPGLLAHTRFQVLWLLFCFIYGAFYSYYTIGTFFVIGTALLFWSFLNKDLKRLRYVVSDFIAIGIGLVTASIPSLMAVQSLSGSVNYIAQRDPWASVPNSSLMVQHLSPVADTFTYNLIDFLHKPLRENIDLIHNMLSSSGFFNEGKYGNLNVWAVILGFLLLYFIRNHNSEVNQMRTRSNYASFLFCIVLSGLLWSEAGNFGTLFSMTVNSTLRAYARLIIFSIVALFLFIAVAASSLKNFDALTWRKLRALTFSLVLLCTLDSLTLGWPNLAGSKVAEVENYKTVVDRLPANCKVLQFPVIHFYWQDPGYPSYALLRPGLISSRNDVHWSAGAIGGTASWVEQESKFLPFQDGEKTDLVSLAKERGYCAIYIDSEVWRIFSSFKPWPNYPTSPKTELESFLKLLPNVEENKMTDRVIYISIL